MNARIFAPCVVLIVSMLAVSCGEDSPSVTVTPDPPIEGNPDGVLLVGGADLSALDAIVTLPPSPAAPADIDAGLLLTRLVGVLAPGATVGDVNQSLDANDARIVTMWPGLPVMTLKVERFENEISGRAIADALAATNAFSFVHLAREAFADPISESEREGERDLPPSDIIPEHLEAMRFPAAWNAASAATQPVSVVVPDYYHSLIASPEIATQSFLNGQATSGDNHGFHVSGIVAANFDDTAPNGTSPDPTNLLDTLSLPVGGLSWFDTFAHIKSEMPSTGRFILNTSLGTARDSDRHGQTLWFDELYTRALDGLIWRMFMGQETDRFLHFTAAGNEADRDIGTAADAEYASPFAVARFWSDTRDLLPADSMDTATQAAVDATWNAILAAYPWADGASPNAVVVGSVDRFGAESAFSNRNPDLFAVGEGVLAPCVYEGGSDGCSGAVATWNGTSMATPGAAGLAAYLWSLKPSLTVTELRDHVQHAYTASNTGMIDAYLAVLALDGQLSAANAPVRHAILDVVGAGPGTAPNGVFDEHDITQFLTSFETFRSIRTLGVNPDYSRYDLNGNGYTGEDDTETAFNIHDRFDLDISGPSWGQVQQMVGGTSMNYDETSLTDPNILCYYAYSPLFAGDAAARDELLLDACNGDAAELFITVGGLPGRASPGEPYAVTVTVSGVDDLEGIAIDLDVDGGDSDEGGGLTGPGGVFTTNVWLDPEDNELSVEASVHHGELFAEAETSALRTNSIEILSREIDIVVAASALVCTEESVPCPYAFNDVYHEDPVTSYDPFDDSRSASGTGTMEGMSTHGSASASAEADLTLSGGDFSGATFSGMSDGSITLTNPNHEVVSYSATALSWAQMDLEFVVWGTSASFNISGSASGQYGVELGDLFECDSWDSPCGSLSASGVLEPGEEYDFDVYVEGGGHISWSDGCTDCDTDSGTESNGGTVNVTLTVSH